MGLKNVGTILGKRIVEDNDIEELRVPSEVIEILRRSDKYDNYIPIATIKEVWKDISFIKKGYEIRCEVFHVNKPFKQVQDEINEDEEIASYEIVQECRNRMIDECFKDFWVFVPQPDKISKKNNYVAGFVADSDRAGLNCSRNPSFSDASLGVFVIRKKNPEVRNDC